MPPIDQVIKQSPGGPKPLKSEGILSRIKPVGFDPAEGIKVLLYGRSGTGKTHVWGSFPKPIVALVCSGGLRSGELRTLDTVENRKLISTAIIHNTADVPEVCEAIADGQLPCATLVLDHASGLQDKAIAEILGVDEVPVQKAYRGFATQQQWGQCTAQCKEVMRAMLSLSCNVVIVAQERTFNTKDELGEAGAETLIKPYIGAGLTPSLTGWLNTAADYIVYTFKRRKMRTVITEIGEGPTARRVERQEPTNEVEYCMKIGADNTIITKFRVPLSVAKTLPDTISDPSYAKIKKAISGGYGAKEVKTKKSGK